jgi:hypothetical protein
MKIRITRNRVITTGLDARKGDEVEVSDALASQLIKRKAAVAVPVKAAKPAAS